MNIFFLSFDVTTCSQLYCDQHVTKILLEIVQMLYSAWHLSDDIIKDAPFKKGTTQMGYKIAHPKHPMVSWVRSSEENYRFTTELGNALAKEYTCRYGKIHACEPHVSWLIKNVPSGLTEVRSEKAFYATDGTPSKLTPIPECMPEVYHDPNVLIANFRYYRDDKLSFARWSNHQSRVRFNVLSNYYIGSPIFTEFLKRKGIPFKEHMEWSEALKDLCVNFATNSMCRS